MHAWQYLGVAIMMSSSLQIRVFQTVLQQVKKWFLLHPSGVPTDLSDSHTCAQIAALRGSSSTFRDISTIE
jgi:hypothetical protein